MPPTRHRRTYLVDRSFQLKYILLLMAWGLALAALFGVWAYQAHEQAIELLVRDAAQRALVDRASRQLLWVLGGIALLSTAALGLIGFIMTHRVAGPVYVMGHFLSLLSQGRYPSRRALRKHDELQRFHGQFLQTIDALKERERIQLARLADAAERMRAAAGRAPELLPAVAALEAELRERTAAVEETLSTALPLPLPDGAQPADTEARGRTVKV
jgi:hypothetical protein